MNMHLFSTPVECTNCGTVVEDPTVDRCPSCKELLRERRTPRRLAGVEKRYGTLRVLLGLIRFLGIAALLVSVLVFAFGTGDAEMSNLESLFTLLGGIIAGAVLMAVASFFEVVLDMEENTRSAFRLQQMILEQIEAAAPAAAVAEAPSPTPDR